VRYGSGFEQPSRQRVPLDGSIQPQKRPRGCLRKIDSAHLPLFVFWRRGKGRRKKGEGRREGAPSFPQPWVAGLHPTTTLTVLVTILIVLTIIYYLLTVLIFFPHRFLSLSLLLSTPTESLLSSPVSPSLLFTVAAHFLTHLDLTSPFRPFVYLILPLRPLRPQPTTSNREGGGLNQTDLSSASSFWFTSLSLSLHARFLGRRVY
jgi:hypothetical protein